MELSKFVDEELYPSIFLNLDRVFPEMKFEKPSGSMKWRSPFNMDGTSPKHRRKDKTVVTETNYQIITENGGAGSKNIISYFMEKNAIADRIEAIRQISNILGLLFPEGENAQKWEEIQKQREELALSFSRQKKALFDSSNPEAVKLLQYLREERGYSDEIIQKMGLGYISKEEAKFLKEKHNFKIQWNVADFPLSQGYFSNGYVIGFKFRYITAEAQKKYGNGKYRNALPEWVDMNKYPFGILPNNLSCINKKKQVIVMEGNLDASHATALDLPNVIATSGGGVVPELAEAIRKNGYKNVVILLDSDEAGQKFTGESVYNIDEAGLNSFTATIPGAKDPDEYLKSHTIDELREIVENATFGGLWLYNKEKEKFLQKPTEVEFFKFIGTYIDLACKYREPYKREILFTYLRNDFPGNIESIEKGIRDSIEKRLKATGGAEEPKAALESLKETSATVIEGRGKGESLAPLDNFQDALGVVISDTERKWAINALRSLTISVSREAEKEEGLNGTREDIRQYREEVKTLKDAIRTLKKANQETGFSYLLKDNTEELYNSYKEKTEALGTKFELYHQEGGSEVTYSLTFPSGALSIIGAATGNGKSKILQSIALDAQESLSEGETLLFITYEENEQNVNIQFENSFFNDTLTAEYGRGSNLTTITDWLTKGETRFMRAEAKEKFLQKEEEWKSIRRSGKIKIVKPEDNYLDTLISLIDYSVKHFNIRAILIDYVQEIYVEDWKQYSRSDELKKAMVELDTMAQKTKLPIVMGAQLSREAASPLELNNQCIADSSWIERKASEIVLVWSSTEKIRGKSVNEIKDKKKKVEEEIPGFEIGKPGKLYFLLTKSRIIPKNSTAVVDINSNTGKVSQKLREQPKPKPKQTEAFEELGDPSFSKEPTTYDNNVVIDAEAQSPYRRGKDEEEETETPSKYREELDKIIKLCNIGASGMSYGELEKKLQEIGYSGTSVVAGSSKAEKIIKDAVEEGILSYEADRYYYNGELPF